MKRALICHGAAQLCEQQARSLFRRSSAQRQVIRQHLECRQQAAASMGRGAARHVSRAPLRWRVCEAPAFQASFTTVSTIPLGVRGLIGSQAEACTGGRAGQAGRAGEQGGQAGQEGHGREGGCRREGERRRKAERDFGMYPRHGADDVGKVDLGQSGVQVAL